MEIDLTGATVHLTDGQFDTVEAVKANALASCEYGAGIAYDTPGFIKQPMLSLVVDGRVVFHHALYGTIPSGCTIDIPHTRLTLGN